MKRQDDSHFRIHVDVEVSNMFLSWIMGLGEGAQIVGPAHVLEQVRAEIMRLQTQYLSNEI